MLKLYYISGLFLWTAFVVLILSENKSANPKRSNYPFSLAVEAIHGLVFSFTNSCTEKFSMFFCIIYTSVTHKCNCVFEVCFV